MSAKADDAAGKVSVCFADGGFSFSGLDLGRLSILGNLITAALFGTPFFFHDLLILFDILIAPFAGDTKRKAFVEQGRQLFIRGKGAL